MQSSSTSRHKRTSDRGNFNMMDIVGAIKAVKLKNLKLRTAAMAFQVPRNTLRRYLDKLATEYEDISTLTDEEMEDALKRYTYAACAVNQVFSAEEEKMLVGYAKQYNDHYNGMSIDEMRELAYQFAKKIQAKYPSNWETNKMTGRDWYYGFRRRHPELSLRTPEQARLNHIKSSSKENVQLFFDNLDLGLTQFFFQAVDTWNMDETSFSTVSTKVEKHFRETGKAPRTIHCINLESNLVSPKEQPLEFLPERWQTCVRNMNKKFNNQSREKTLCRNLVEPNNEIKPGLHMLNPIVNMMPTVSFQNIKIATKKPTSEPLPNIKVEPDAEPEEILPDIPETYYTLETETLRTENQTSRLPQLRKTTPRLAKTRSAQNIKSMTQVVNTKEVSSNALKTKSKSDSSKTSEASTSSSVKGDDEDEIAELMLASTTIKKNAASRKKAKQARELENLKRLLESENELNVDERATKFAASYLQKLHATLESTDPETFRAIIKLYLDYNEKLENIIQTEHDNELKTDESRSGLSNEKRLRANIIKAAKDNLAIGLYREVTAKLANYPDMCSDFLLFLNSHQAAMIDKSVDWMMLQKMQEFVHVAQVYFAKQPSRLAKVMQSIAQLAAAPHTLKNVHEVMGPVLKGYPVVMDMFLQVFPDGKPPESLFAPQLFESVTCPVGPHDKTKVYAIDAAELYEHIELPVSTTQEDPYGGDNCKCNCHDSADPKLKTASEHCASCGTRFLNGRIYLQTSEGLRPAKITFPGENEESLENIARVSLKPAEKLVLAPSQPKRRRKSSKNDPSTDEIATKQPTFKISPVKDGPEEVAGDKLGTKSKRGPRSPPKSVQPSTSGIKKPVSKSKREKRAEKRDAKQEQNFEMKSPQYEEFTKHSFVKEEILSDEDEKEMCLDKNDASSDSESSTNCELEEFVDAKCWSREEDAILLQGIKKEYSEQTFLLISGKLTNRTVQQVKDRCFMLLDLLQKLS